MAAHKTQHIYRLIGPDGRGIFFTNNKKCHPRNFGSSWDFEYIHPGLSVAASQSNLLFACPTKKSLKKYFHRHLKSMIKNGAKVLKIKIPRDYVWVDKNQCIFNTRKVIEKKKITI